METFLNLAWALLALSSVCLWARFERRTGTDRRRPIVSLLMLIAVLFPVISVSDDLWSIQNPAETDILLRRDHHGVSPHLILPTPTAACQPGFSGVVFTFRHSDALPQEPVAAPSAIPIGFIQNRPPPAI